jgi:hypothetical protein
VYVLRRRIKRILIVVIAVVVALGIVALVHGHIHENDATRIQGEWLIEGTDMTVVIDDSAIKLPSNVDYDYTVDTFKGIISFTYGDRSGTAHYTLKDDGDTLVLKESYQVETDTSSTAIRLSL